MSRLSVFLYFLIFMVLAMRMGDVMGMLGLAILFTIMYTIAEKNDN